MGLDAIGIKNKSYINDKNRLKLSSNHNLKTDTEMHKLFSDLPEALFNNYYLPYKCNFKSNCSKPLLPEIASKKDLRQVHTAFLPSDPITLITLLRTFSGLSNFSNRISRSK